MKQILATLLLLFTLVGCTSQRKIMDSWLGANKHKLIMSWGPPQRTADDGDGGEILIYAQHIYAPSLNMNYWSYKMFYTNKDGIVYHWRTSNQQVAPTEIDVRFLN